MDTMTEKENIRKVSEEVLKSKSPAINAVRGQAEDLKRFAEANGVNIIIVMSDQKEYEPENVVMCQMGHVNHDGSSLPALHALHQNMERAKDILETKIMHKMIKLKDEGKLDIKLSKEELEKLEHIKKFFAEIQATEE